MKVIATAALMGIASAEIEMSTGSFGFLSHEKQLGEFHEPFTGNKKPSVFAGILTFEGSDPSIAAVTIPNGKKNFMNGAMFHVDEPACFDGKHLEEQLDWMAFNDGVHQTDEGKNFIVGRSKGNTGKVKIGANGQWTTVDISKAGFTSNQLVVIAQAQSKTNKGGDKHFQNIRVQNIGKKSFQFHIENDPFKLDKNDKHSKALGNVDVSYFVIEVGNGHIKNHPYNALKKLSSELKGKTKNVMTLADADSAPLLKYDSEHGNPLVFASMTHRGQDTAFLRIINKKHAAKNAIRARIQEPAGNCKWDDVNHAEEQIFMFLLSSTYECNPLHCKDWACQGPGGWCECFDESDTALYEANDCFEDPASDICECADE